LTLGVHDRAMNTSDIEPLNRGLPDFSAQPPPEGLSGYLKFTGALAAEIASPHLQLIVDTLGFLDCGYVILDRSLRTLYFNKRAQEFVDAGLLTVERHLSFPCRSANQSLNAYLRRVISGTERGRAAQPKAAHVPRVGRLPLIVSAYRLPQPAQSRDFEPHAIVRVTDPEFGSTPCQSFLQVALGLTNCESGIAAKLADGLSLIQIARLIGISHETARTHLKNIFAKTNTNRQSQLVALFNRIGTAR
jgi:DNA-binding CsgD family transcriptional regulator